MPVTLITTFGDYHKTYSQKTTLFSYILYAPKRIINRSCILLHNKDINYRVLIDLPTYNPSATPLYILQLERKILY